MEAKIPLGTTSGIRREGGGGTVVADKSHEKASLIVGLLKKARSLKPKRRSEKGQSPKTPYGVSAKDGEALNYGEGKNAS